MAEPDAGVRVRLILDSNSRPRRVCQDAFEVLLETLKLENRGRTSDWVTDSCAARSDAWPMVEMYVSTVDCARPLELTELVDVAVVVPPPENWTVTVLMISSPEYSIESSVP